MKLLLVTLFLSGVLSAPFSNVVNVQKSTQCDKGRSRFHPRKTLLYAYEGETLSGLVGTSGVRTGLKLRTKCEIVPVLPCVFKLKITEAELLEGQGMKPDSLVYEISSGSSELRRELMARDLYFKSNGGMIDTIRPEVGEPTHVLNMKRGILSAFQSKFINDDETHAEVDVAGECSAKFHVKSRYPSGKVKTIVKTKDLTLCKDRSETNLGFPTTPYPTDKPFSLLNSKSLCKFVVSEKDRLGKVFCEETHLFRPFSSRYNKTAGAMTTVRQNLTLVGHGHAFYDRMSLPATEKSLKYEHPRRVEETTKNDREVRMILEKLVTEGGTKPDSGRLFSKLIFALRRLNMKALKSIWYRYYDCRESGRCTKEEGEKYQTFIVDALSQCGTLECAQYMVTQISEKKVGTHQSIAFLTGIAMVGKPSEDMVGNILYFCQETPSRTAFLTLGTLMHKFCRQHDCTNLNPRSSLYQADNFLKNKLRQNCQSSSPEQTNSILLALKAIGNAGRPFSAVRNILKCAVQPGSTVINVEALQALRRVSCTTEIMDGLLDIFRVPITDTEIRIESYLALMRCPSETIIRKIADVLDNETSNQVGSFVWSHLTNALESTEPVYGIPLRNIISKALQRRKLRPFNLDHLRFSHAYETSYYNKKQEVGGSSQAQVVFHPNSYFPRSAKFNLTFDIFGASINLLETAARFEGFESLIEQMFGTEGYFPDERIMKLLKPKELDNDYRGRRNINDMDEIKSNLEMLQDKIKIERKNPSGGLSFKVFGHELQFLSFEDIDWLQGEADSINFIDALINLARGGQVTYTKSFHFLEADHEIPTALGFPLRLAVNGSAVSSINLKGKFDIRNMFWGKKKLDIRGSVSPSAVVDISGKMSVNAKHASSGIHVNTSLYTATEMNGNATFKEGEGIKLSIEPPSKPVYIVNVTSNLATYLNQKTKRISGSQKRFDRQICTNFTRLLGINVCEHISLPLAFHDYNAPYFPLTGESSFGMVYETTNANLARFELEGRALMSKDDNRYDWIFNMHIPGLTFGRRIEANSTFQFLPEGKYLGVSCGIHDYKIGRFEATYNNVTNGFHTKFSTPEMSYLKPITIESEVFNKTNLETREHDIGFSINASYNDYTIQEVVTVFKHDDQYGFKSNLTYWPRKHITTEGRISLEKKNTYLRVHDTSSKSDLIFTGKFGKTINKFFVKIGNDIMKYELKLDGEVNIEQRKVMLDVFTKPSGNLMKFEAYPRGTAVERGFYMSFTHVNSSSKFSGYLRASNTQTQKTLKFNGIALKEPFRIYLTRYMHNHERKLELVAAGFGNSANASVGMISKSDSIAVEYFASLNKRTMTSKLDLFKDPRKMGFNLHASLMKQSADMLLEYFHRGQKRGLHLKLAGANRTIDTIASYFVNHEERGLDFTVSGMDRSAKLIAAYYKREKEIGLKLNASAFGKSMEIAAGLFTRDDEKGLKVRVNVLKEEIETSLSILLGSRPGVRFVASAMKKNIEFQSTFFSNNYLKEWRVDALYNRKKMSFLSTYVGHPNNKSICSELVDSEKVYMKICSRFIRTAEEIALHHSAELFGRKAELKTSYINSGTEKGGQVQLKYNNHLISDVFIGVVSSSSYNGLRFRGSFKDKNLEALLKYNSKRSIELQLHIQGRQVSFETLLIHEPTLKGIQMNVVHQNQHAGSIYVLLARKSGSNILRIGLKTAHKNGVEYKLSTINSRVEKKFASIITVTANNKPYKYGLSIFYRNMGTTEEPNHVITTKLHYSRNKELTSVYQMLKTKQHFHLRSYAELAPGQFLTNKFVYSKLANKITVRYEFLPGLGITYEAAAVTRNEILTLNSTVTVLDYPMESLFTLDKQTRELKAKISYCPARPPIEISTHMRTSGGIDVGFALSVLEKTWSNSFLLNYSSRQMKLMFDVLPEAPIEVFAKMFGNDQFVLNISTCSVFSAQLACVKPSKDEYQLIFTHQFRDNLFEDLKLTVNFLHDLRKLKFKWNSKMAAELLKSMNLSMENLINKTLTALTNMNETVTRMTIDTVEYLRIDGRKMVMAGLDSCKTRLKAIKQHLKGLKINDVIETCSSYANEMLKTMTKCWNDHGTKLKETYRQLEKTLKDFSTELTPHLRTLSKDIRLWLIRSVDRYRAISICGWTLGEMTDVVLKKALSPKLDELKSEMKKLQQLAKKVKISVDEFTCEYDIGCTVEKLKVILKKLTDKIPHTREQLAKHLEKVRGRVIEHYRATEKMISQKMKDQRLRERASKLLIKIRHFLESLTLSVKKEVRPLEDSVREMIQKFNGSRVMVYYDKMVFHAKQLVNDLNEATKYIRRRMEIGEEDLKHKIEELKHYLMTIHTKSMETYQKMIVKISELRQMNLVDIQTHLKKQIKENYRKFRKHLNVLIQTDVKAKAKAWLEQYSREIDRVKLQAMNRIEALKRAEVTTALKRLVERMKPFVMKCIILAKSKISELWEQEKVRLNLAFIKVKGMKRKMVRKIHQLMDHYEKFNMEYLEKVKVEGRKLLRVYEGKLKEVANDFKDIIIRIATVEIFKFKRDAVDMMRLYQDMPIESIIQDLRKRTKDYADKILGFVIVNALSTYGQAITEVRKVRKLLQDNEVLLAAKWKMVLNIVRDMKTKYRAFAEKQFREASRYYDDQVKPLVRKILIIRDEALSYSKGRYNGLKLWYEQVKHLKFKEIYRKSVNLLQSWEKYMKSCRDTCEAKFNDWKAKFNDCLEETMAEFRNVVSRVRRANEEIRKDAITTFRPHETSLKNVLRKHVDFSSKRFDEMRPKYQRVRHFIAELKTTTQKYVDTALEKWIKVMESFEFLKNRSLMTTMIRSFNKCPFLTQVRDHKLWPTLKDEFLDHELVAAAQKLKSSVEKLRKLSKDYFANSVTELHTFSEQIKTRAVEMRQQLLTRNDMLKRKLQEKREELELKLGQTHKQLRVKGQEFIGDVRKMYNERMDAFMENLEYLGEMSLYDVQLRAMKYHEKLFASVRSTYNALSENMAKRLEVLEEKRKVIIHHVYKLRGRTIILAERTKKWCKNVCMESTQWITRQWNTTYKQHARRIERLITQTLQAGEKLFSQYSSDLMKMKPSEIVKRIRDIRSYRRQFESLKTAAVDRLRKSSQAAREFINSINVDMLGRARLNAEVGLQLIRSILKDARKQTDVLATKVLQAVIFLNRFYGIETMYSRRPELVEFADYHLQKFVNCTHICKAKVMRFFNETTTKLTKLRNGFPKVMEFFREEIKQMEALEKLNRTVKRTYEKVISTLNNLKALGLKQYREMLVSLEKMDKKYLEIINFIKDDLPTLLKNARGKVPLVLEMIRKDLKTLMDNTAENLRRTWTSIRHHVRNNFDGYTNDVESVKEILTRMRDTSRHVIDALRKNMKDHLPQLREQMKNMTQVIGQVKYALSTGDIEMKLSRTDVVYKIVTDIKNSLDKQYEDTVHLVNKMITDIRPMIVKIYHDNKEKAKTVIELCKTDLQNTWRRAKQDFMKFDELRLSPLRKSTEQMLISIRDLMNKCKDVLETVRDINGRKFVTYYTKELSEKSHGFVGKVKIGASNIMDEVMADIQKLRTQAMDMKEKIMHTVEYGRISTAKIVNVLKSAKIDQFVDMEDLMNKTIEISEDVYNLSLVSNLVDFGRRCYIETSRMFELTKETTEFALYILKYTIKNNDLWGIIGKMADPFYWLPPSNSIAMIFGRPHVYTFDGQYYEFVGYKKPTCTYVLAHDMQDKSFTLMSQETSLILTTKSGDVKIHADGRVESSVKRDAEGNEVNVVYKELPVEMKNVTVTRDGSLVKITHDGVIHVTCDLKHFFCTFNINKFYHGKLAGLLGTNNNEQYDEFMKPDKTIAKSTLEFANSWEITRDPQCKVSSLKETKTPCNKRPSPRCRQLFKNNSSPLATYFKSLNPEPFYRACIFDTSDCKTDIAKSYCNVTAAYTALLREKGVWAQQISECATCGSKTQWQAWTQPGGKNVDVVLLIPETTNLNTHAINLPEFLKDVDRSLVKYKPRYAVVGFGGKSGIHRRPHTVTAGGKIFSGIHEVTKAVEHMQFTNERADAVEAVEYLASLPFSPGASKVVILLTDQSREAMSSRPIAKAINDLKNQGVIFNVIGPYFQKKQHRNMLGLWKDQAFQMKEKLQNKLEHFSLPSHDYIQLAESSEGAIFNLKAFTKSHGQWKALLKKAMRTTLIKQIDNDQTYCRQCFCIPSWTSEPISMCRVNRNARCS